MVIDIYSNWQSHFKTSYTNIRALFIEREYSWPRSPRKKEPKATNNWKDWKDYRTQSIHKLVTQPSYLGSIVPQHSLTTSKEIEKYNPDSFRRGYYRFFIPLNIFSENDFLNKIVDRTDESC